MNPNPPPPTTPRPFHTPALRSSVNNPFKVLPISGTGDVEKCILDTIRSGHLRGERTWNVEELQYLYWDMELQELEQGFFYKTQVLVTALLNVHRHMVLWSDPTRYPEDQPDQTLFQDLQCMFQTSVWTCIMKDDGPWRWLEDPRAATGRDLDQAFVRKLSEVLRVNAIEGTNARFMRWETPRRCEGRWTRFNLKQPDPWRQIVVIPPPVMTRREAEDGPYNYTRVWPKPINHWNVPDYMW